MEKIKGLAIELDLDHLSVDRGLKGLKDNLKTVNAEMRRNMSAFDMSDRSVQKYETRLSGLNKKLEVQKQAVAEAKKEYEEMVKQHGHGSKEAEKAAREYNNQAAALNNLERYIGRTKDEIAKLEREQRIANSSWTKLGDKLEKAGGKLQTAGKKMGEVGSTLTNKITKPALGAAGALASLALYKGFQRLVGIDTARAQLKALGHDAESVEQIMDAALASVKGTSYGLDEAATTAATAVAAGVDPAKDLEKYLSLAADTAAVANIPFSEMGDIFNKVQTSGKAQNDVLQQLSQRGIPIYQYLGETIGKSTEEVEKMARDGKISTKDFLKAVEKNIGGAAKIIGEESFVASVKNIGSDIGRIGANFLDAGGKGGGFFSKLKPMLVDFRGWLEKAEESSADLGVKFGEAFENMVEKVKELKGKYDDLTPAQQDFVKKVLLISPAVAVGIGPALKLFGSLTTVTGGVLKVAGKLSKAIGVARGAGLAAGLASLGPMAVGGIAVAGLAGIAVGLHTLRKKSEKAKEVNLDLAESLTDEAIELENVAETFDKLSDKAKISNAELAELNDLNIRISESSNPGEIEALQEQYDQLAKKSGLSKDELKKLFEANEFLIEQAPDVEKSISDQGNAFVESTEKVQEHINRLLDLSRIELEGEREKQLKRQTELKDQLINQERQLADEVEKMQLLDDLRAMSQEEILILQDEIVQKMNATKQGSDEWLNLNKQLEATMDAQNGKVDEQFLKQLDIIKEKRETINLTKEELEELDAQTQALVDIYLKQVGINEQGEKGLAQLDENILKNQEEIAALVEKLETSGQLTEEEKERFTALMESTNKMQEMKEHLFEELGVYKDLNSLANGRLDSLDEEKKKRVANLAESIELKNTEKNIVSEIDKKNGKLVEERSNLEENRKKQGANKDEIDKQISSLDTKISKNAEVKKQILQELGVWDDLDSKIKDGINSEIKKGGAVDDTKSKLNSQGSAIDNNNAKTDQGIKKEQERSKEAGKDVSKTVSVTDGGTVVKLNERAIAPRSKLVQLRASNVAEVNRQASSPVTKVINFVGKGLSKLKFWEKGTPPSGHPGGPAVIGEKGSELVRLPSGRSFLSPSSHTLLDLPRGAHVIPHQETKRIIKNAPRYAAGTDGWASSLGNSELARLLSAYNSTSESKVIVHGEHNNDGNGEMVKLLMEQNEYLKKSNDLLARLLGKDLDLYKLNRKVDEGLNIIGNRKNAAWGG